MTRAAQRAPSPSPSPNLGGGGGGEGRGGRVARTAALLGLLAACAAVGAGVTVVKGSPVAGLGPGAADGVAYAAAPEAADLQAQRPGTQVAEPMGPFEYTVNTVLGRYLNVPGTD